jgi:hypothetical protein
LLELEIEFKVHPRKHVKPLAVLHEDGQLGSTPHQWLLIKNLIGCNFLRFDQIIVASIQKVLKPFNLREEISRKDLILSIVGSQPQKLLLGQISFSLHLSLSNLLNLLLPQLLILAFSIDPLKLIIIEGHDTFRDYPVSIIDISYTDRLITHELFFPHGFFSLEFDPVVFRLKTIEFLGKVSFVSDYRVSFHLVKLNSIGGGWDG